MSELLQLLTMKPNPIVGARFIGDLTFSGDDKFVCCVRCNAEGLTIEDFYIRTSGRPYSWCKSCVREYKAALSKQKINRSIKNSARNAEYKARAK